MRDRGLLVIVCGQGHRNAALEQLADIGISAIVLLEPEARDSAPAMAAAAAWIARTEPDGVAVHVASDHHLPDADAFCAAAFEAAAAALDQPRILALGVRPTAPSSADGYIEAAGPRLSPVASLVDKPTRDKAEAFFAEGYLWKSGNFVVHARTLLDELARHAP
jgi:mannose-1-phosphate guanylyltransferase